MNYTIFERVKQARIQRSISRQALIDEINQDIDRPKEKGKESPKDLEFETYRRWEDGTNKIPVNWIPTLCRHLRCDVGYLFGEYGGLTRVTSDICKETGLSEKAAESLIGIFRHGTKEELQAINTLLENEDMWKFLGPQNAEKLELENPLHNIGRYFSGGNATNGIIMPSGEKVCGEGYSRIQTFIDRANLDAVEDSLKAIKKAVPGDCPETAKHDP